MRWIQAPGAGKSLKHKSPLVFWELVLILASVLGFRSLRPLLDKVERMNHRAGLWASLAVGVIVGIVALVALNRGSSDSARSVKVTSLHGIGANGMGGRWPEENGA